MDHIFSDYIYNKFFWITISIVLLSACGSTGAYQAYEGAAKSNSEVGTFNIPGQYNLLSIDGVKYDKSGDGAIVKLLPGRHQFIIEYQDFIELGGEEYEKVESKPFVVTFTAQAGTRYNINSASIKTVKQAQVFAEKPSISVINSTTRQTIPAEIKYNLYGGGLFTTLFGSPTPKPETSQNTPAAATIAAPSATPTKKLTSDGRSLEMLKLWWDTANEKQRVDFRHWLINH